MVNHGYIMGRYTMKLPKTWYHRAWYIKKFQLRRCLIKFIFSTFYFWTPFVTLFTEWVEIHVSDRAIWEIFHRYRIVTQLLVIECDLSSERLNVNVGCEFKEHYLLKDWMRMWSVNECEGECERNWMWTWSVKGRKERKKKYVKEKVSKSHWPRSESTYH